MICIVQRVSQAGVTVDGNVISSISQGMLVLAAVERTDTNQTIAWTAQKLATLRIFRAEGGNFDQDVKQIGGSILLVSNFTVAAETSKGRRPSLSPAADPLLGRQLFDYLIQCVRDLGVNVQTGEFGADMQVNIANDGPVTFIVRTERPPN